MKKAIGIFILLFSFSLSKAQYIIPNASQQPAWVFPIYLEEGNGGRDTLYLGFDSTASLYGLEPADSIFGVRVSNIDTSIFNATWGISAGWPGNLTDTAYKVLVTSATPFPFQSAGTISFMNAIYPLKISWDVNLLRSDSLPFADQGVFPRAQCELTFDMPVYGDAYINGNQLYCGFAPLLISDQVQPWVTTCLAKDSVSFNDIFNTTGALPGTIFPSFKTWTGEVVSTQDLETDLNMDVYPNPASYRCTIKVENKSDHDNTFQIFNVLGAPVKTEMTEIGSEVRLDVSNLEDGIYYLTIQSISQYKCFKLIVRKNM